MGAIVTLNDCLKVGVVTRTTDQFAMGNWQGLAEERGGCVVFIQPDDAIKHVGHSGEINSFLLDHRNQESVLETEELIRLLESCRPEPRCVVEVNEDEIADVAMMCRGHHKILLHPGKADSGPSFDYLFGISTADNYFSAMRSIGYELPI